MPVVKIHVKKGHKKKFLCTFLEVVHETMVDVLKVPASDRNQMLSEYKPDLFWSKPPYEYFIEITMFTGRSIDIKRLLYKQLVNNLNSKLNINPEIIFIILNEQPLENWGIKGGQAASDVKLDFNVNL